jgi:hypothetical protein
MEKKRPAHRSQIHRGLKEELEVLEDVLAVLTHEITTIAIDEFLDLKTRRALLRANRQIDEIRRRLFSRPARRSLFLVRKKKRTGTVLEFHIRK